MAYGAGLRASEVIGLKVTDVDKRAAVVMSLIHSAKLNGHVFEHALTQWRDRRDDRVHGCSSVDERGGIASTSTVAPTRGSDVSAR